MIDLLSARQANESIVPLIYEAAAEPRRLVDLVRAVVPFLDCQLGFVTVSHLPSGRGQVLASVGFPAAAEDLWERCHASSKWVQIAARAAPGQVLHATRTTPVDQLLDTPAERELLQTLGVRDAVGIKLLDSTRLVVAMGVLSTKGRLGEPVVDRLRFLGAHVARSVELHRRVSALGKQSLAFEQGMDALRSGVLVLRPSGEVVHQNARARRMASHEDGFSVRAGRIQFPDVETWDRLEETIQQVLSRAPGAGEREWFRIERPSGKRGYLVAVTPATPGIDVQEERVVVLWMTDPEEPLAPDACAIAALLGLTPAESRVGAALAAGQSLREYAASAGISVGTARWTLKCVLNKTNTRSQVDLVRLITQNIPSPPF